MDEELVLPVLLAKRAEEAPDAVVHQPVEGSALTYAAMHDQILMWAAGFERLGVTAGDVVVTMLPTSSGAHPAWLALSWLGATEAPVNHEHTGWLLEHLVVQSGARFAIVHSRFEVRFFAATRSCSDKLTVVVLNGGSGGAAGPRIVSGEDFFAGLTPYRVQRAPRPHDIAAILFTSGTTGLSKGVRVPWRQLLYTATGSPQGALDRGEAMYAFSPPYHSSGKCAVYRGVLSEGLVVTRDTFSVRTFWDDVDAHDCVFAVLGASSIAFLLAQPADNRDRTHALRGIWGSPISASFATFRERFGVRIATAYGSTEAGVPISSDGWVTDDFQSCGRTRSGPPWFEARLVDEHDETVADRTLGELVIRTVEPWALNGGYHALADVTASAWRNGWFHTGDAFTREADGRFVFRDRLTDSIRRRAENISSMEVERFVQQHPAVFWCAAIGVASPHGDEDVKVCVVARDNESLSADELYRFCSATMPRFMVPRFIEMMVTLPFTAATGRVQKAELRRDAVNGRTWDAETAGPAVARRQLPHVVA